METLASPSAPGNFFAPLFLDEALARISGRPEFLLRRHAASTLIEEITAPFGSQAELLLGGAGFHLTSETRPSACGGIEYSVKIGVDTGAASGVSAGLRITFTDWSVENYVLMPAAVYGGNRFRVAGTSYPFSISDPAIQAASGPGPDMEPIISPVPRLAYEEGPSLIQQRTGDFSTPGMGFYAPAMGLGFFLLTDQGSKWGNHGLSLEESADRSEAVLHLLAPGVRLGDVAKGDCGADLIAGDVVDLRFTLHLFPAASIQEFYAYFFTIRDELRGTARTRHDLPFSAAWAIQEEKYNSQNWVESLGYYSVGMRDSEYQDWQTGWVGGLNAVLPLLAEGDEVTQARVIRTFDFLIPGGQFPSGFFRNAAFRGNWLEPEAFLRHSADALTFLLKEFALLRERHVEIRPVWLRGAQACAEAFVTLWRRYGQFGQYVDGATGDLLWGGTACAGIAPGGLALAAKFFDEPEYLSVACEAAEYYHKHFVAHGLTNGGPGDILQAPDSESAFGLLDGFMLLYEATAESRWLRAARDVANQAASWVVSYDFEFPGTSTFGRLDMLTTGTVFANVQNKHSAPGICSLSGDSLLRLFRATGEIRYLDLLREIAHAIPQFLSRADRVFGDVRPGQPYPAFPPGWMNERVNMSDWEVSLDGWGLGVGEVFGGSTWAEVALMLTWTELPGIYIQRDTGILRVLDHVNACIIPGENGGVARLEIENPTRFPATIKVFAETSIEARHPLGIFSGTRWPRVRVAEGETIRVPLV